MEAEQATFNGHLKWGPPGLKGVGSTVVQFTSVLRSLPCDQAKNTLSPKATSCFPPSGNHGTQSLTRALLLETQTKAGIVQKAGHLESVGLSTRVGVKI